jgi:hypothetical protein
LIGEEEERNMRQTNMETDIFLCESRNEYRNIENKYKNGYFRKQKWNEYGTNTDEKRMIIGTKRPPESCSKTQAS